MKLIEKYTINVPEMLLDLTKQIEIDPHFSFFLFDKKTNEMINDEIKKILNGINELIQDAVRTFGKDFIYNVDNMYWIAQEADFCKVRYTSSLTGEKLSGAIIIPKGTFANLPILSYQHGTKLVKKNAPSEFIYPLPSVDSTNFEMIIALILATYKGYIVSMPDYPGMGEAALHTSRVQPYMCAQQLACSVGDLLLELKNEITDPKILQQNDFLWNNELFLTGYSQGGYVTMASTREIQKNPKYSNDFKITASAPMAGPYSLSEVMRGVMLRKENFDIPYFLPLTIRGFHSIDSDPIFTAAAAFQETFVNFDYSDEQGKKTHFSDIYDLLDKAETSEYVDQVIRSKMFANDYEYLRDILSADMLRELENPESSVYALLQKNDASLNWTPASPMTLYHCPNDDAVPYENAIVALQNLKQTGADVHLDPMFYLPINEMVHAEAFPTCMFSGYKWFSTIRNQYGNKLASGDFLVNGQSLISPNKQYCLRYQMDGDVAVYDTRTIQQKWRIGNSFKYAGRLLLNKTTGVLELYDAYNLIIWQSQDEAKAMSAELNDEGALVLLDQHGHIEQTINSDIIVKLSAFTAPNGKAFLFLGNKYFRYSDSYCTKVDKGYPRSIKGNWGTLPDSFDQGIDTIFKTPNGKTFMFKADAYVRYSDKDCTQVDTDYPRPIKGNWGKLPAAFESGIDAIFTAGNGKTYMFKGNEYLRYSDNDCTQIDPDFPRKIKDNWGDIPPAFTEGIDAIFKAPNGKTYMFKGNEYLRYSDDDCTQVDPDFPRKIKGNWGLF